MGTATGATKAKTCRICKLNVSAQPRTKDPAGNYYCRPCWAKLQQPAADAPEPLEELAAANETQAVPEVAASGNGIYLALRVGFFIALALMVLSLFVAARLGEREDQASDAQ